MIKVLIVDDSALVRKLLGRVLSNEADFEVSVARSGAEALALLGSLRPDVVTLDIHMPEMDGLECLDRIMIEHPCRVVMVSSLTRDGADATLDALRLGAVDFITKPDGAVSLRMDAFAPEFVAKVRSAANARLKASLRLRERVRHKISGGARQPGFRAARTVSPATGDGLVVVGTSTGGPPALEALLGSLPAEFPWPIVIAQHMPASFTGPLARRLDGIAAITVLEVVRATILKPGHAYIARGDEDLVISRRGSDLLAAPARPRDGYPWRPSTNRLVRSAMEHIPATNLVGVLMTGMGNDGAEAMAALHAQGGRTIAEAESTAVVWGMPGELVRANGANWVLPLPDIGGQLRRLVPAHASHQK